MKRFFLCFSLLVACLIPSGCDSALKNSAHKTVTVNFAISGDIWPETSLSFYLHSIYLLGSDGEQYPFLPNNSDIAHPDLTLIELNTHANRESNLRSYMPQNTTFEGLIFKLGVPQPFNHANPLTAKSPLDNSTMFWSWQQGYKFLRIDSENANKPWAMHLGSTDCQSPSPLRPPKKACERPNIAEIELKKNFDAKLRIAVSLADLQQHIIEPATSCTGNYTLEKTCETLLSELGIDAQSGQCIDHCRSQSLFSISK